MGIALCVAGFAAIIPSGWTKTIIFIFLSPLVGLMLGFTVGMGGLAVTPNGLVAPDWTKVTLK